MYKLIEINLEHFMFGKKLKRSNVWDRILDLYTLKCFSSGLDPLDFTKFSVLVLSSAKLMIL